MCEQQVDQVAQDCGFPDRGPGLYQLPGRRSRRNSQTVKIQCHSLFVSLYPIPLTLRLSLSRLLAFTLPTS